MLIDGKTAQRIVYLEQKACVLGEQEESGESLVGFNSWPISFQLYIWIMCWWYFNHKINFSYVLIQKLN